jgi:pimeloyl-ACP methyl ester carboxylesterase
VSTPHAASAEVQGADGGPGPVLPAGLDPSIVRRRRVVVPGVVDVGRATDASAGVGRATDGSAGVGSVAGGGATGGTLAVAEIGSPSAPAWVMAHGIGSSARFVAAAFAPAVQAAGRRLVVYDLRGHGASLAARDPAAHHLDVHGADLAAVVADAGPLELLGGVSLGAHAAVRALRHGVRPRRLLACLPAWLGTASRGHGPHAAIAARLAAVGISGIVADLRREPALAGWLRRTLVTDYSRHDERSLAAALTSLDGGDAPTEAELAAIDVPLAVVGWPDDPGHPLEVARRWVALAPSAGLVTVTIDELEAGVERLGERAVAAVAAVAAVTDA